LDGIRSFVERRPIYGSDQNYYKPFKLTPADTAKWPDEYKCACCRATKPPDEILWDIWEKEEVVICIDCGEEGLEIAKKGE
jgi:hypothetical protein